MTSMFCAQFARTDRAIGQAEAEAAGHQREAALVVDLDLGTSHASSSAITHLVDPDRCRSA